MSQPGGSIKILEINGLLSVITKKGRMKTVEYRVNITTDHHIKSRGLFYYKDGGILTPTAYFKRPSVNIRQE
jgi:hypothetical protein